MPTPNNQTVLPGVRRGAIAFADYLATPEGRRDRDDEEAVECIAAIIQRESGIDELVEAAIEFAATENQLATRNGNVYLVIPAAKFNAFCRAFDRLATPEQP